MNMQGPYQLRGIAQVHQRGGDLSSRKHWWKLSLFSDHERATRRILTQKAYSCKNDEAYGRLGYLATRALRGMISYHKRPVAELRRFCKQRGLEVTKGLEKGKVILLLEEADEQAKFPKFMDLPPELREMVYGHYFEVIHGPGTENWRERPFDLGPPPITSVSKLLRKESLPLFYAGGIMKIEMSPAPIEIDSLCRYREAQGTTELFAVAPQVILDSVKVVEILVLGTRGSGWRAHQVKHWNLKITLPTARTEFQIDVTRCENAMTKPKASIEKLFKDLGDVLDGMAIQINGKLQRKDIYPIRKAFQVFMGET